MSDHESDFPRIGSPEWWILMRWIYLVIMGISVFGLICWEIAQAIGTYFEDDVSGRPPEQFLSTILIALLCLVFGLIFGLLGILSVPYQLVIYYFLPWFYTNNWWPHIIVILLTIGVTWLPEGRNIGERFMDALAKAVGYVSALINPTTPTPDLPTQDENELKQNAENVDLSTQLQKELNRIDRLQEKLKEHDDQSG